MAIPKQVEQQMKELEEMERQMQAPENAEETVAENQSEPIIQSQPTEVMPTQVVAPEVPEETWHQKYSTLIGKYNAEVPRLHQQVKDLAAQLEAVHQRMQERNNPTEASDRETLVTDRDREAFGDDLIDLNRRVAREVASVYEQKLNSYEAKIASLEQRLMQTGNQVGEMTFEQRLLRVVPDFDQVDSDPRWVAWLNEIDPLLRAPRRVVAEQAFKNGDVDGVAHYVNLFKGQGGKQDNRKSELERQVAPSRVSSGTAQAAPQGKMYSMNQWSAAYDRVAQLVATGKYDDANKLEAELSAAMSQGRVTA